MTARIFRISLVITLLFTIWVSTGFLKLVQENGISFSRFEASIARADAGGGGTTGDDNAGFEDGAGVGAGAGAGGTGDGGGPGAGGAGSAGDE